MGATKSLAISIKWNEIRKIRNIDLRVFNMFRVKYK